MSSVVMQLDRLVGRLLFVTPQPATVPAIEGEASGQTNTAGAERAFGFSLAFSGVRCILQYVILPFVLPLLGLAGALAAHLTLLINVVAIVALVASLRRFWRTNYKGKWQYLAIAVPSLGILNAFFVMDIQAIML